MFLVLSGEVWIEQNDPNEKISFKNMEEVDSEEEDQYRQSLGLMRRKTIRKVLDNMKFKQKHLDDTTLYHQDSFH
jgi:hypothetical protein